VRCDFDAIVIGVGAMGSAALYHLARRGQRVLGLEQFDIPHEKGSSHGFTRIIRLPYYEDPSYVPLLYRAFELWREAQQASGYQLLHVTGSIDAGPADSTVFLGALRSCELYSLKHEILDSAALTRRFPGYRVPRNVMALLQPDGGFLVPETSISAHVMLAQSLGAEIHAREPVMGWEPTADGVQVRTGQGWYKASRLVLTAGAWMGKLAPALCGLAIPERQVLAWFQPLRPDLFTPERFPVFNLMIEEGRYYGLPVYGVPGFKVGRYHHRHQNVDPDLLDRSCSYEDEQILRSFAMRCFPDGAGPTMALRACLFTNTPDEHFVIDLHPELSQVVLASPCSGHGFKFASVIGEILADLAICGDTHHDIRLHRLQRLVA
jgi:sarcosine oxidase